LRCKRAVPRSSSQDRSRRRDCNVENIQEYLETRGQSRSRAEESSYILEKKAGRGIYILENILEYESARDPLYTIFSKIFENMVSGPKRRRSARGSIAVPNEKRSEKVESYKGAAAALFGGEGGRRRRAIEVVLPDGVRERDFF